jgi:hypothetical protein
MNMIHGLPIYSLYKYCKYNEDVIPMLSFVSIFVKYFTGLLYLTYISNNYNEDVILTLSFVSIFVIDIILLLFSLFLYKHHHNKIKTRDIEEDYNILDNKFSL